MKKDLCRNFQRGSCQYGARCKFIHANQQQPKVKNNNNAFGFGAQNGFNQQEKPNPFGFGVQNNSQPTGPNNAFGNKQNQFRPYENKWSRFSPIPSGGASSTRSTGNQSHPADHKCTDPASCKRIIEEDFKNERPLWKLTCYGHWKHLPCDFVGDVSCEELRAAAYDDAKRGVNLQSIVERERNLLNSKLVEFDSFLRSPYKGPANSVLPNQSAAPGIPPNPFSQTDQNIAPPNSFSPIAPNNATPNPSIAGFVQPGLLSNSGFGASPSAQANSSFGQPNSFPTFNQPSNAFGTNSFPSGGAGSSGFQTNPPAFGSPFNSNTAGSGNSTINASQSNQFSAAAFSTPNPDTSKGQMSTSFAGPNASSSTAGNEATNVQSGINSQQKAASADASIWLKEKWSPGEIPEQAPPDAYV